MQNAAATESEPLEPIVVMRSVDRTGQTFALHPLSNKQLAAKLGHPKAMHPRVFVAHVPDVDDIHRLDRDVVAHVVHLLTGTTLEALEASDGVEFFDAGSDEPLEFG